eukprot:Hpha_TRINITY_DN23074_c0_g1::TRINITY_DN23074_c0_g1_i1::g.109463::m.109463
MMSWNIPGCSFQVQACSDGDWTLLSQDGVGVIDLYDVQVNRGFFGRKYRLVSSTAPRVCFVVGTEEAVRRNADYLSRLLPTVTRDVLCTDSPPESLFQRLEAVRAGVNTVVEIVGHVQSTACAAAVSLLANVQQDIVISSSALVGVASAVILNASTRRRLGFYKKASLPDWMLGAAVAVAAVSSVQQDITLWTAQVSEEHWAVLDPEEGREWWVRWVNGQSLALDGGLDWRDRIQCMQTCVQMLTERLFLYRQGIPPPPAKYQEDTTLEKIQRAAIYVGQGVAAVAPFAGEWQILLRIIGRGSVVVAKHGPAALGLLFLNDRVMDTLNDVLNVLRCDALWSKESKDRTSTQGLLVGLYYLMVYCRGQRGNAPLCAELESTDGAPGVVSGNVKQDIIQRIKWYAPFMVFSYEDDVAEVQRLAALRGHKLLCWGLEEPLKHPAYYLLADATPSGVSGFSGDAILVIRGSKSTSDWMIDATARPATLRVGDREFTVHRGMLRGTLWMHRILLPVLRTLARWGYKVRIVGHSLGAGVGILLAALLRLEIDVQVYAFGTPAVCDAKLAEWSREWCTTCILGDDLVPRLRLESVRDLLEVVSHPAFQDQSHHNLSQDVAGVTARVQRIWPRPRRAAAQGYEWRDDELSLAHSGGAAAPSHEPEDGQEDFRAGEIIACPECLGEQVSSGGVSKVVGISCHHCHDRSWFWRPAGEPPMLRALLQISKARKLKGVPVLDAAMRVSSEDKVLVHFAYPGDMRRDIDMPWLSSDWGPYRRARFAKTDTVASLYRWIGAHDTETPHSPSHLRRGGSRFRLWAFRKGELGVRPCVPLDNFDLSLSSIVRGAEACVLMEPNGHPADGERLIILKHAPQEQAVSRAVYIGMAAFKGNTSLQEVLSRTSGMRPDKDPELEAWAEGVDRPKLLPRGERERTLAMLGISCGSVLSTGSKLNLHVSPVPAPSAKRLRADPAPVDEHTPMEVDCEGGEVAAAEEWPKLYAGGRIVHLYRVRGTIRAAEILPTAPTLMRVEVSESMIEDHQVASIMSALRAVRIGEAAARERNFLPEWEPFEHRSSCSCCGSEFGWQKTGLSGATREINGRMNCSSCGRLSCTSCCKHEIQMSDRGILQPAAVCDRCYWTL